MDGALKTVKNRPLFKLKMATGDIKGEHFCIIRVFALSSTILFSLQWAYWVNLAMCNDLVQQTAQMLMLAY